MAAATASRVVLPLHDATLKRRRGAGEGGSGRQDIALTTTSATTAKEINKFTTQVLGKRGSRARIKEQEQHSSSAK